MMIDESYVKALEMANEDFKINTDRMSKDYELLKKEKTELENEVENLKSQIREMEKQKKAGKWKRTNLRFL